MKYTMTNGIQLLFEMADRFYNAAYNAGARESKNNPGGSFTYRQGYENGKRDTALEMIDREDDKEIGMNIAWNCARKAMLGLSTQELCEAFNVSRWQEIFLTYNGIEAVNKLKEWEKNHDSSRA